MRPSSILTSLSAVATLLGRAAGRARQAAQGVEGHAALNFRGGGEVERVQLPRNEGDRSAAFFHAPEGGGSLVIFVGSKMGGVLVQTSPPCTVRMMVFPGH
mmetsp:Transcript_41313/g.96863  ORF Transcript_41313/g.96863 Transcript_41313/m.96863 type:complete len:101 (+) Transcript_41313:525-827(+)